MDQMQIKIWNFKFEVFSSETSNIDFHYSKLQIWSFSFGDDLTSPHRYINYFPTEKTTNNTAKKAALESVDNGIPYFPFSNKPFRNGRNNITTKIHAQASTKVEPPPP